mgnify:FL=1|tara:strand:+ start:1824 stop:2123 length:300 start_codon:yes stop_codon:yes gene_type:complete
MTSSFDLTSAPIFELLEKYNEMKRILENRREVCRKSSKQYYNKTFKLNSDATHDQIIKNKEKIEKRDIYQKSYYDKNKEKIRIKQKEYRERRKANKSSL